MDPRGYKGGQDASSRKEGVIVWVVVSSGELLDCVGGFSFFGVVGGFVVIELFWSGDCCCFVVVRAPGAFPLGAVVRDRGEKGAA